MEKPSQDEDFAGGNYGKSKRREEKTLLERWRGVFRRSWEGMCRTTHTQNVRTSLCPSCPLQPAITSAIWPHTSPAPLPPPRPPAFPPLLFHICSFQAPIAPFNFRWHVKPSLFWWMTVLLFVSMEVKADHIFRSVNDVKDQRFFHRLNDLQLLVYFCISEI